MPSYDSAWMLANTVTLTVLLGIVAFFAWRRRGIVTGLRWTGVAMLPFALYLIGLMRALWIVFDELVTFFTGLAWKPSVWLGLILLVVAVLLIVLPGRMRDRAGGGTPPAELGTSSRRGQRARGRASSGGQDDDLAEIEAILKRRGID